MYTSCNVFGMLVGGVVNDAIGARAVMVGAGAYMIVLALPALLFARRVAAGTVRPSGQDGLASAGTSRDSTPGVTG